MASIEIKTSLGGPGLLSSVNRMADYLVGTGLIRGLHQNSSLDKVVLASSVASIERQTSLGGPGLITSVNRKKDLPGWACPNQWCESKCRLACVDLAY